MVSADSALPGPRGPRVARTCPGRSHGLTLGSNLFQQRRKEQILATQSQAQAQRTEADKAVALVTGGSRGIGRSAVVALAKRGIDVIFTYNNNADLADDVVQAASHNEVSVSALQLDVSDVASLDEFTQRVRADLGKRGLSSLRYLINDAGLSHTASFADTSVE